MALVVLTEGHFHEIDVAIVDVPSEGSRRQARMGKVFFIGESNGLVRRPNARVEGKASAGTFYLDEVADLSKDCQLHLAGAGPHARAEATPGPPMICGSARDLEAEVEA